MKKGLSDIVQRLSGWGELPDYRIISITDEGAAISIKVAKEEEENERAGNSEECGEDL